MPRSYNKHYTEYRTERQSKLPHRNPQRRYQSLVTGEWHDLETRETWQHCSYHSAGWYGDREEDAFNLGKEATEKQIEELKSAISSLKWILTPVCTGYRDGDHRQRHWNTCISNDVTIQRVLTPKSKDYSGYRATNLRDLRKSYCSKYLKNRDGWVSYDLRVKTEPHPIVKLGEHRIDEYYLQDLTSIENAIHQLESLRANAIMQKQDTMYFFRATEVNEDSKTWSNSVEELSEDNPYRAFRVAFEAGLVEKRERLAELQGHLARLQSEWDNYYSDVANLRVVQDERDKKYRQRVERRAEIKASQKARQHRKEQEAHAVLVAEVASEMQKWREDVHAGKDTCGCTSSPNSEGIRTLKVNYATLEEATAAAKSALINSDLHLRPYHCEAKRKGRDGRHYKCGGFHLSSSI